MMRSKSLRLIAAAGWLLIMGHAGARAQDPAVVNPKTIKVKLENERVRVLEAVLRPGVSEQIDSHPAYVIYVVTGGRFRSHAADGKTTESDYAAGDTLYVDPRTHWAENIGTTTIRLVLVELKNPN